MRPSSNDGLTDRGACLALRFRFRARFRLPADGSELRLRRLAPQSATRSGWVARNSGSMASTIIPPSMYCAVGKPSK